MNKTLLHITTRANGASPVESGRRATAKGYIKEDIGFVTGVWAFKHNYTALFFKNGKHMTWVYGKGRLFPEGVSEGDIGIAKVVGHYSDKEVACYVVTFNGITTQP